MNITVYGSGCAACKATKKLIAEVLCEMGIDASVETESDYRKMLALGILSTQAILIDGRIVCTGHVPGREEIRAWTEEYIEKKRS